MSLILAIFYSSFLNLNAVNTGWVSPSTTWDSSYLGNSFAVGVTADSIVLIQTGSNAVIEFDIASESFTTTQTNILPSSTAGSRAVQIGCQLYIARGNPSYTVYIYDLSTKQLVPNSIPSYAGDARWCTDSNYIYLPGGYYSRSFRFLDVAANQWYDGPSCIQSRYDAACAVANGYVYSIGGVPSTTTIEKISTNNILSNSWSALSETLSIGVIIESATVYEDRFIYVVGGHDGSDQSDAVSIIDTNTDTVTLSPHRLVNRAQLPSLGIVNNVLYAFGASHGTQRQKWQKLQLEPSDGSTPALACGAPTQEPTTLQPSKAPTEACSDMVCNDGKYCNGEEYCLDGVCYPGEDIDCGFAFVCDNDTAQCIRECGSFDIDGYLQCSNSFGSAESNITSINTELDGIDTAIDGLDTRVGVNENDIISIIYGIENEINPDITSLDGRVTVNEGDIVLIESRLDVNEANITALKVEIESSGSTFDGHINTVHDRIDDNDRNITGLDSRVDLNEINIGTLQTETLAQSNSITTINGDILQLQTDTGDNSDSINEINGEIATLQTELSEVEDKIDRLGAGYMANANVNPMNIMDGDENNNKSNSVFETLAIKDILIIGFLFVNMIMSIYNCIYNNKRNCNKDFKGKYAKVISTQFSDSELSENQQLNE